MQYIKRISVWFLVFIITAAFAGGAMAQERRTITVTGEGVAYGSADMATIEIGVTAANSNVGDAYSEVNQTIDNVINAVSEQGVADEDIRTIDFNIFTEERPGETMDQMTRIFRVSNRVQVRVRNVDNVEAVIDAAVDAGANNIFGLNFTIQDTTSLESEARANALDHARARAEEIATDLGLTLGQVVSVQETADGFPRPLTDVAMSQGMGGGGGAVIEQGSLAVTVRVIVSYEIGEQ